MKTLFNYTTQTLNFKINRCLKVEAKGATEIGTGLPIYIVTYEQVA